MNKRLLFAGIIFSSLISGCTTIIGGFTSTAKSSGSGVGPSTIAESDVYLHDDRLNALSVYNGSLTAKKLTIVNSLKVNGDINANKLVARKTTDVTGSLTLDNSSLYDNCKIGNNITANDSYFAKDIEFGGIQFELTNKTKVIGNIISTSKYPVTIVVDRSVIKGDIGFANPKSVVIIQNRGLVKGRVLNGTVRDLTGGDSYQGDDADEEQQ